MGLNKVKNLNSGYDASHHALRTINYEVKTGQISVMVETYKDLASMQADASPVSQSSYSFNVSQLNGAKKLEPAIYDYLKTLPEFSGAADE